MESIKRAAVVIKPKQLFVDWMNSIFSDEKYTLDKLIRDNLTFLIPTFDNPDDTIKYLKKTFHKIFDWELNGWWTDRDDWPENRNWKMFQEWFDIEIGSEVFDLVGSPIEIEMLGDE